MRVFLSRLISITGDIAVLIQLVLGILGGQNVSCVKGTE